VVADALKKKGKAEKERPEGMSNVEWAFDLHHRKVENASCPQMERKVRERKALAAEAMEAVLMQRAASMARMTAPAAWGSQGNVSSPLPSSASLAPGSVLQKSLGTCHTYLDSHRTRILT
jgi:hypothetical protein